jgi:hypothetical protein
MIGRRHMDQDQGQEQDRAQFVQGMGIPCFEERRASIDELLIRKIGWTEHWNHTSE